jgi:hypothetical protein
MEKRPFQERGRMPRLALQLMQHKEKKIYTISAQSGATRIIS